MADALNLIRTAINLLLEDEKGAGEEWAFKALAHGFDKPHCGDCTNVPMSCFSCLADDYLERAKKFLEENTND